MRDTLVGLGEGGASDSMNELEQLTALCARLGAAPAQAGTMAAQLLKRADQLAVERSISREQALAYLVELTIRGRNGEPPPAKPGTPSGKSG